MQHPLRGLFLLSPLLAVLTACTPEVTPTTLLTSSGPQPFVSTRPTTSIARFDDRLVLIDFQLCSGAVDDARVCSGGIEAGRSARLHTRWLVTGELAGRARPQVVAALVPPGATGAVSTVGAPFVTSLSTLEWRPGDVVEADVDLAVTLVGAAHILVGVVDAGRRWNVTGTHDVIDQLARIGTVDVRAGAVGGDDVVDDGLPVIEARKITASIVVDGALDEADWQRAAKAMLGPYKLSAPAPQWSTSARLLWAADALYLAFDVDDDDPFSPYTRRDDPLYDSEALEIFIDADGDRDVYVELQTSPTNQHFDAAFAGGARKNMDRSYNHDVVTATKARPGGYTQEWRIPIAGLRDVPEGEPKVGARWRINLFRLERRRSGDVVTSTEASAWSAVAANDFHALDRFGTLIFVD